MKYNIGDKVVDMRETRAEYLSTGVIKSFRSVDFTSKPSMTGIVYSILYDNPRKIEFRPGLLTDHVPYVGELWENDFRLIIKCPEYLK